jgi:hypothetical protein
MANLFDKIQKGVFKVAHSTFGYMVSWAPSAGGETITAKVLFKEPTKKDETGGMQYSPFSYSMEFDKDDLPGFIDAVRNNDLEIVIIYEIGKTVDTGIEYYARTVESIWDGKTYMSLLELKQD